MTLAAFKDTFVLEYPPKGFSVHLQALWYDAKGEWTSAHSLIDRLNDATSAHIHAYLHRKEGDLSNAEYWYNRAGQALPKKSLDEEWEELFYLLNHTSLT